MRSHAAGHNKSMDDTLAGLAAVGGITTANASGEQLEVTTVAGTPTDVTDPASLTGLVLFAPTFLVTASVQGIAAAGTLGGEGGAMTPGSTAKIQVNINNTGFVDAAPAQPIAGLDVAGAPVGGASVDSSFSRPIPTLGPVTSFVAKVVVTSREGAIAYQADEGEIDVVRVA